MSHNCIAVARSSQSDKSVRKNSQHPATESRRPYGRFCAKVGDLEDILGVAPLVPPSEPNPVAPTVDGAVPDPDVDSNIIEASIHISNNYSGDGHRLLGGHDKHQELQYSRVVVGESHLKN